MITNGIKSKYLEHCKRCDFPPLSRFKMIRETVLVLVLDVFDKFHVIKYMPSTGQIW